MRMLTLSVLVLGAATIALAEEARDPRPEGPKSKERRGPAESPERGPRADMPNVERLFKALDANADGEIGREEFDERFPELMARWHAARGPEGGRPAGMGGGMMGQMREKTKERDGGTERPKEAKRPGPERSEGPPAEMGDRLAKLVEMKVNEAIERRAPEIARRIREAVAKDMREIMERRAPEIASRVQALVDRKVREAFARRAEECGEGPRPPVPQAGRLGPGPGGPRAFAPSRERERAEIPGFGAPLGKGGRDRWFGEVRRPRWQGDGCACPWCKGSCERAERSWGPPRRAGWSRGMGGPWERPVAPPAPGRDGPRERRGRGGPDVE